MQTNKRIIVKGRVQGVFYRASAKEQADTLGVRGEVQNCRDGSVEIKAEGDEAAITAFIRWCQQGPPRAKVEEVLVEDSVFTGYSNFKVIKL